MSTNCLHDSDISLDTSIETSSNSIDTTTNSTNKIANNESISTDDSKINLTDDFNIRSSSSHNSFEDEVFKCSGVDDNNTKNEGREAISRSSTCTDEDSLDRFEDEVLKCLDAYNNKLNNNPKNEGREDIDIEDIDREDIDRFSIFTGENSDNNYEYSFEKKGGWNTRIDSTRSGNNYVADSDTYPDFKPHHNSTGYNGEVGNINLTFGDGTYVPEDRAEPIVNSTFNRDTNFSGDTSRSSPVCGNNGESFSELSNRSFSNDYDSNNFTHYYIKASPASENQSNGSENLKILEDKDFINLHNLSGEPINSQISDQYYYIFDWETVSILYDIIRSVFGDFF